MVITFAKLKRKIWGGDEVYNLVSKFFDTEFYLQNNADVRECAIDPVTHYLAHGHDEDRDPTPTFSTRGYRTRYPDVATSGINCFYHFIRYGRFENRITGPVNSYFADFELVSGPNLGSGRKDTESAHPSRLADHLPTLDFSKVNRLLGVDVSTITPRRWRVGMTRVLSGEAHAAEADSACLDGANEAVEDGAQLAQTMLSAAQGKTLSLDLWDTILRRDCAPDAIKLRHARAQWLERVAPAGPLGDLHPVDLLQLRRMAEADSADKDFEYRISDVADRLAPLLSLPGEDFAKSFLAQEVRIEKRAIRVDDVLRELITNHEGPKIVLSDFYMPANALEELLQHVGTTQIDRIYSSSDHLATKRAGGLYDLALERESLKSDAVLHVGDRFSADVAAPRQRGIAAFHYYSPSHQPRLDRLDNDFWNHVGGDTTAYARDLATELGYQFNAPPDLALTSLPATCFVMHVMEEALRRKVPKVFFFTREGEFFRRIYDILAARDIYEIGHYPPAVTVEVSRRATFAASLQDFTIKELMRLWSQYSKQSVSALATTLNIDINLWADFAKKANLEPEEVVEQPWRDRRFANFVKNPVVARVAREAISIQRSALVQYLEAVGFEPYADKERLIVDIGWRGTIQDNLAYIVSGSIHGCYLGMEQFLNPQPVNSSKTGYAFDTNRGYPLSIEEVAGLEFLFNTPGGSTIGYRDGIALREIVPEEEAIVTGPVAAMQEQLLDASATICDYVQTHGLISADLVGFAREVLAEFVQRPPPEVAQAFFHLSHNETFGTGSVDTMCFEDRYPAHVQNLKESQLHGEVIRRMANIRWPLAARQLPSFRELEISLSASQRLHLPVAPALVRSTSLGRPRVAVLSPTPIRGSGGHRTIFNFAAALARRGYDVHLMHEQPTDRATAEWVTSVLGDAPLTQHDAWLNHLNPAASVATIWYSARYALEFWGENTAHFYFVQDYEAMFNPMGDTFLRASQSYSWGARHICVGRWLAHHLRAQFGVGVASGGLGVDHHVYRPLQRVERRQNQIALLFQPEKFRRAPELCAEALAIVKSKMPHTQIVLYGSDEKPTLPFAYEHLGLIADVSRINDLYNSSAIGLCISSTNPSRIPFEMMASGCVPVDIYRYNNLFDYDSGTGLLAHESPESIAEALMRLLNNPIYCSERSQAGIESVRHRSLHWEMDVAVNAVDMGMDGFDFNELDPVHPSYLDNPVIADVWDTPPVNRFLEFQWQQANSAPDQQVQRSGDVPYPTRRRDN
jgi:O-antigen biosynthesis protein